MSAATAKSVREFDPVGPEYLQNPWAEFRRMRESCRAYRHEGTLMPVVSVFHDADIRAIRADAETWSSARSAETNKLGAGKAAIMIGQDAPEHTRYRQIVAPLFMPGKVGVLQPFIDELVDQYLGECIDNGEIDWFEDVSAKLATAVICRICGVQPQDWAAVRNWTADLSRDYGKGAFFKTPQPQIIERVMKSNAEFGAFVTAHIKTLRRSGTPSILLEVAEQIDDDAAVAGLCMLILGAGNDTSSNLMANGLHELMREPEQLRWLRDNPDKINSAVEEMIRCRGSLRMSQRFATRDMTFADVEICRGDTIAVWNASASRDPAVVPDRPDAFDVRRPPARHLGFGSGIHMCIGNILARLEARSLFNALLARTSSIEEAGDAPFANWGNGILDVVRHYHLRLAS